MILTAMIDKLSNSLARPISPLSLAAVRIAFGAIMVWDVWRFFHHDRIRRYYVEPEFQFTYPGFSWVAPLPDPYIHYAWFLIGVFAFLVMIGLFYRVAIIAFTVLFTYFFLLDKAQYLNHFYMVILYALLLCAAPANRALSLDARFWPSLGSNVIPYWAVFALRAQTEIILIYAGLVKISEDWLNLQPLAMWLRPQAGEIPFGWLLHSDWVIAVGAYGAIALHLIGAPLLLWSRTRLPVFLIYCAFHCANAYFFNIGVFPWLTIAITTIFFAPDWPRQLVHRLGLAGSSAHEVSATARPALHVPRAVTIGLAIFLAIQIMLPLRFAAFASEVRWTGEGHRFAWRMRLYSRYAQGHFEIRDRENGQVWRVLSTDYLTRRQARIMLARPDMIWQFAKYLERKWHDDGHRSISVHARIGKSLNGRPMQVFIDPNIDLTAVRYSLFAGESWVVELDTPLTQPFLSRSAHKSGSWSF
jgi:vitamin K-dependent gamma-carboxylase